VNEVQFREEFNAKECERRGKCKDGVSVDSVRVRRSKVSGVCVGGWWEGVCVGGWKGCVCVWWWWCVWGVCVCV